MTSRTHSAIACLLLLAGSSATSADLIVFETFTGYPDNALLSTDQPGHALGLEGTWYLDSESDFYVNRTEADPDDGTGQAVYDRPSDDNGGREAMRATYREYELLRAEGDVFYAGFRARTLRASGDMLLSLMLQQLDGGGQPDISFGMINGQFIVGHGGVDIYASGGAVSTGEMLIVLRVEYANGGAVGGEEIVTLWVDPASESSEPVIDRVAVDLLNRGGARISSISIRGEHMLGLPAYFDNLMVATRFDDIIEADQAPALAYDAGINGLFYDPAVPGHGFDLKLHEFGLTVFYYGHTAAGERLWLVSELHTADLDFGMPFELQMIEVSTGVFGAPVQPETHWGTLTMVLLSCDSGRATFDGLDGTLEVEFVRLAGLEGVGCAAEPQQPGADIGLNGVFFDPATPGQGFDFNRHEAGLTVFFYGHTAGGERLWLISELYDGTPEFGVPFELQMVEVLNGEFGTPMHEETAWGTITVLLQDCDTGFAFFEGLDGSMETRLVRLAGLADIGCR